MMLRTAFFTALLAVVSLAAQAQTRSKSTSVHKEDEATGKVAVPVGPVLPGEEKLSAQERAERTFLMPPRKKMPSVRPTAPRPQLDPGHSDAVAIGPPTVEEMAEEKAAAVKAAAPRTTVRSSSSVRRRSTVHRSTSSKKKTTARRPTPTSKKKTTGTKRRR